MYKQTHEDIKIKTERVQAKLDALESRKKKAIYHRIEELEG